jgi:hypothetical protein
MKDLFLTKHLKKKSLIFKSIKEFKNVKIFNNSFYQVILKKKLSQKQKKNLNLKYINELNIYELNFKNLRIKKNQNKFKIVKANNTHKSEIFKICKETKSLSRFWIDQSISFKFKKNYLFLWLKNFFLNLRGDLLLVSVNKSKVLGFVLLKVKKNIIQIDQIVINKRFRNKGIASKLIINISNFINYTKIIAGTDSKNYSAKKLYFNLNFKKKSSCYNYHLHT